MYPYSNSPKPLGIQTFYALLALSRSELHPYGLKNAIYKDSLGSIDIDAGRIYRLVEELHAQGLIDLTAARPTNSGPRLRKHYAISEEGTIRLKEEIVRLTHALKIAKNAGLTETGVPLDIQRLLLEVKRAE